MLLICGCNSLIGVHDFDAALAPGDGDRVDVAPAAGCVPRWLDGTVHFGAPALLDLGNAARNDRDPSVTADGKILYYSSQRQDYDIFQWPTDGSTAPQRAIEFDSASDETKVTVRNDGLQVVIGRSGAAVDADLFTASRGSPTDSWSAFTRMDDVDTTFNEYDPQLVGIGQVLYFSRGDSNGQHIYKVSRAGISGAFGTATQAVPGNAADPWATADEQLIVYSRIGNNGMGDLYYQTAAGEALVPDLNTTFAEGDPSLTGDACTIYFASNRGGSTLQIFRAAMTEP